MKQNGIRKRKSKGKDCPVFHPGQNSPPFTNQSVGRTLHADEWRVARALPGLTIFQEELIMKRQIGVGMLLANLPLRFTFFLLCCTHHM